MEPVVIFETWSCHASNAKIGYASLNAPKQLNALNLEMIQRLKAQLKTWLAETHIACIVLDSEGDKAFCAGGDVRQVYHWAESDASGASLVAAFFSDEYELDYMIHHATKPILVWGDGIVMGGGLGLMNGASHRLVTERTRMAMPEVTIGLYPDVGATYFLNQMPKPMALWLGLTGYVMNGADACYLGLADVLIASNQREALWNALLEQVWTEDSTENHQLLSLLLDRNAWQVSSPETSHLAHNKNHIETLLAGNLAEIRSRFQGLTPEFDWVKKAQQVLLKGSPLSQALVWYQLEECRALSLADAFRLELMLSFNCCLHGDFCEGVRAQLIDKDYAPRWQSDASVSAMLNSPWSTNPLAHLN
jgi:enoyl-CoA hydratase/carnithine racemase